MNKDVKEYFINLGSTDDKIRLNALQTILSLSENRVDWVYKVWDDLLDKLGSENSYHRSIGLMVLCNLAKSDCENRLNVSLQLLLAHTRDEKFITSRQCIQSIWKVAVMNKQNREIVLDHLEKRFRECSQEKHSNLLRQDILQSIRLIHAEGKDASLLTRAQELISVEKDEKYRKKYTAILEGK